MAPDVQPKLEMVRERLVRTSNVQIEVIGGTLGSGKTTYIKSLLESGIFSGKKVVVISGDYASGNTRWDGVANPDTDRFSSYDELREIKEVTSGCVCCKSQDELVSAARSSLEDGVDSIIIEASGVTDPERVTSALFEKLPIVHRPRVTSLVNAELLINGSARDQEVALYCAASADNIGVTHCTSVNRDASIAILQEHAKNGVNISSLHLGTNRLVDSAVLAQFYRAHSEWDTLRGPSYGSPSTERGKAFRALTEGYGQLVVVLHSSSTGSGVSPNEVEAQLQGCAEPIFRAKGVLWINGAECDVDFVNNTLQVASRTKPSVILPGRSWLRIDSTSQLEERFVAPIGLPQFSLDFVRHAISAYAPATKDTRIRVAVPEADIAFYRGITLLSCLDTIPQRFAEIKQAAYQGFLLAAVGYSKFRVHQAQKLLKTPTLNENGDALRARALLGIDLAVVQQNLPSNPNEQETISKLFGHLTLVSPAVLFVTGANALSELPVVNGEGSLSDAPFRLYSRLIAEAIKEGIPRDSIRNAISHVVELGNRSTQPSSWMERGVELKSLI